MTKEEREAIRTRCEAATSAPWVAMDSCIPTAKCVYSEAKRRYSNSYDICTTNTDGKADGEFIANARQDIPALLNELETEIKLGEERSEWNRQLSIKIGELENDRDKWKARAKALENATKKSDVPCGSCLHKDKYMRGPSFSCLCDKCKNGCNWQFDEERFAEGGKDDESDE